MRRAPLLRPPPVRNGCREASLAEGVRPLHLCALDTLLLCWVLSSGWTVWPRRGVCGLRANLYDQQRVL